jgi:decaprenylphospho-beta-D-ribofuranose 2-oxidase
MTALHGWGRYPEMQCTVALPGSEAEFTQALSRGPLIARGMGRSYGDSALSATVVSTARLDCFQAFNAQTGVLRCAAGVTLGDIVRTYAPRGWFPAVTPGTAFVTVGGAIASDVHGKNHHRHGTFTEHVLDMEMLLGDGARLRASRTENAELFHATCGGMGLTGIVLNASLQLTRIPSCSVLETATRCADLEETLAAFNSFAGSTYLVAWLDSTARGARLGRSIIYQGEHDPVGSPILKTKQRIAVPFDGPRWLTSGPMMRGFNNVYYARARAGSRTRRVPLEKYFYPLDGVLDWNRVYGKSGLVQYQFVLPRPTATAGLRQILDVISESKAGSCLAVLKNFGPSNGNLMSFPDDGFTLAVDFRADPSQLDLLNQLDAMVLDHGGRIYLAKDARMSERVFKASYPRWQQFEAVRGRWNAHGRFASSQSRRLGLQ